MGTINAVIDRNKKIGHVSDDNDYGVFGEIDKIEDSNIEIETASRYAVRLGEAEIWTNLDGKGLEKYKVEIAGIRYLNRTQNLVLKIKDERLIKETGGIIQGMSGTPIIQNEKLIGAINYVNADDSKEAYGIFIDKLILENIYVAK